MIIQITLHPFRARCDAELPARSYMQSLSFDQGTETILSERKCNNLIYRTVLIDYGDSADSSPFQMVKVLNEHGHYVGNEQFGAILAKRGIVPELSKPEHKVCSVGFCEKEQKWYGWSHRAMCGFGIGNRIFDESYGNDNTLYVEHGSVVIKDLDQARQAAVNFADYVS